MELAKALGAKEEDKPIQDGSDEVVYSTKLCFLPDCVVVSNPGKACLMYIFLTAHVNP